MGAFTNSFSRGFGVQQGALLNPSNPLKDGIIYWLNLLTDTVDTDYDGATPTNEYIASEADTINNEIV